MRTQHDKTTEERRALGLGRRHSSRFAEALQAHDRTDRIMKASLRLQAERAHAPVATRDAVYELNGRIDTVLTAIIALTKSSERSARWMIWLTVALVILTAAVVVLTVALVL